MFFESKTDFDNIRLAIELKALKKCRNSNSLISFHRENIKRGSIIRN
jgi:hypothetical protein